MKKIILGILLLISMNISANDTIVDKVKWTHDTTFVLDHPNSKDSVMVVKAVKNVVSVISVPLNRPMLVKLLNNEEIQIGIVALILGIWRRIEIRRIKRRLKGNDAEGRFS